MGGFGGKGLGILTPGFDSEYFGFSGVPPLRSRPVFRRGSVGRAGFSRVNGRCELGENPVKFAVLPFASVSGMPPRKNVSVWFASRSAFRVRKKVGGCPGAAGFGGSRVVGIGSRKPRSKMP